MLLDHCYSKPMSTYYRTMLLVTSFHIAQYYIFSSVVPLNNSNLLTRYFSYMTYSLFGAVVHVFLQFIAYLKV